LQPGEIVVAVRLPPAGFPGGSRYLKARDRVSYAFALASAAAALRIEGGVIAEARIALGGVAPKPWRARGAEALLRGAKPTSEAFAEAGVAALAGAAPVGDNAFKIELARRVVARALRMAASGTPASALPASPFGASR
jgi:xanthine dehydrogenase YagS FAD-binding subunit